MTQKPDFCVTMPGSAWGIGLNKNPQRQAWGYTDEARLRGLREQL
ncbi:MAG: hypothetical protein ACRC8Y_00430 [Chroococcales cyanobacterium]